MKKPIDCLIASKEPDISTMAIFSPDLSYNSSPHTSIPPPPKPISPLHPTFPLTSRKIPRRLPRHTHKHIMRNHPPRAPIPALAGLTLRPRIPHRIRHTVHTPHRAQHRRRNRPLQSRDQHSAQGGRQVLAKVLVRALRAVERQHGFLGRGRGGLDLLVRGVFEGVRDFRCFAEAADAGAVPGADEEGGDAGEENEAGLEKRLVGDVFWPGQSCTYPYSLATWSCTIAIFADVLIRSLAGEFGSRFGCSSIT
jgi:hypothetical protein